MARGLPFTLCLVCILLLQGSWFIVLEVRGFSFSFPNFDDTARLSLQHYSHQASGSLQLTPFPNTEDDSAQNVAGRVAYEEAIEIVSREGRPFSFRTEFKFQIVPKRGASFSGDGLAFFMSPLEAMPNSSGGKNLGIANGNTSKVDPNRHLLAVEFDTYENADLNDVSSSHIGININSMVSTSRIDTSSSRDPLNLHQNYTFLARIDYIAPSHSLEVRLTNVSDNPDTLPFMPSVQADLDLSTVFLPGSVYVGLSAASGEAVEGAIIYEWSFSAEDPASLSPALGPSGSLSKLNGELAPTNSPFSISISKQPGPSGSLSELKSNHRSTKLRLAIIISSACVVVVVVVVALPTVYYRRSSPHEGLHQYRSESSSARSSRGRSSRGLQVDRPNISECLSCLELTYEEVAKAVKNFHSNCIIGNGTYGDVFKGNLKLKDGTTIKVAVKKLRQSCNAVEDQKNFFLELDRISKIPDHPNVLKLRGWCYEPHENAALLVYELMRKGNLGKYIYGKSKHEIVDSDVRMRILVGVANGLLHLHNNKVVHRDVKAENVLLTDDMEAVWCDFGGVRLLQDNKGRSLSTDPMYTRGYGAPELEIGRSRKHTAKADVFSFGVLTLMIACSQNAIMEPGMTRIADWVWNAQKNGVETLDATLRGNENEHKWKSVLMLGIRCTWPVVSFRPSMQQVVDILHGNVEESSLEPLPPNKPPNNQYDQ